MLTSGRGVLVRTLVAAAASLVVTSRCASSMDFPNELPADTPHEGSSEREVLLDFQRDPTLNAKPLLQLGAGPLRRVAVLVLLAGADVHLRAGRFRAATRWFKQVVARGPDTPWSDFAELGMGWIDLVRGSYASAERHYASIGDPPALRLLGQTMRGWLAGVRGDYPAAIVLFDAAASAPEASANTAQVATLGAGYARYWAGQYGDARTSLRRLAARWPDGTLVDDARYAAAWALLRSGDVSGATTELAAIARPPSDGEPHHYSRAEIDLAPKAVIRAARRDSKGVSGFSTPDARLAATFDRDGAALAQAALTMLHAVEPTEERTTGAAAEAVDNTTSDARSLHGEPGRTPAMATRPSLAVGEARSASPAGGYWLPAVAALVVLIVAGSLARRWRVGDT